MLHHEVMRVIKNSFIVFDSEMFSALDALTRAMKIMN